MSRPGPALLVALLAGALVLASVPVGAGPSLAGGPSFGAESTLADSTSAAEPPTESGVTVSRVTIAPGDIRRTGADGGGLDLGTALAGETAGVDASYDVARVKRALEAAPNASAKREVLREAVTALETDVATLRERERAAIAAYAAGEIDARRFLARLAAIDDEAHALGRVQTRLTVLSNDVSGTALSSRLSAVDAALTAMHGPVRDRVSSVIRGQARAVTVEIRVGADSVVLATIDGGTYNREALLLANRQPGGPLEIDGISEASQRATELYPWAFNHSTTTSVRGLGGGIYQIVVPHEHGQLTAYLDASTGEVFRETHHLHHHRIPRTTVANVSENDMRLVVNRTFPGGPLQVSFYRNGSGSPIDGTILVDGVEVAPTGEDGVVWIHEPATAYTLAGRRISLTVNVTIDPTTSPYAAREAG